YLRAVEEVLTEIGAINKKNRPGIQ
ncbi:hypothetical protein HKBW3S42_02404, partial [Candidatus Hakubella thermalkaliphila]